MHEAISAAMRRYNHLIEEIEGVYHEMSLRLGVSGGEMMVLYAIWEEGDRRALSEIVRVTGASKQTIHSGVRKLEARGAAILNATDGKHKEVCLTEAGRALAERTAGRVMRAENEVFESWSAEDVEKYLALTERFKTELRRKGREME